MSTDRQAIRAVQLLCLGILISQGITVDCKSHVAQNGSHHESALHQSWQTQPKSESTLDSYSSAAIASDSGVCAEVAKDILFKKKGNIVDAGIASLLCDGVINMQSTGIGGGSFLLIYIKKSEKAYAFDFREVAPSKANKTMFSNSHTLSTIGGLSVAVPGQLAGYRMVWKKLGGMPWAELFQPTIRLCENGFSVTKSLARSITKTKRLTRHYPEIRNFLTNPETGTFYKAGDVVKNPKLAQTLRLIAKDDQTFFSGSLGATMASEVQNKSGILTREDLQNYQPLQKDAIRTQLKNSKYTILEVPPPASGAILGFILRVLDGYNFNPNTKKSLESYGLFYHRLIETFKFAYVQRSRLGDGRFVPNKAMKNLTSQAFADHVRSLISDDKTHPPAFYGSHFAWKNDHGTTHLSIVSPNGDALSWTASINNYFGSKVRGSETGIIFNDSMDDFSIPGESNSFGLPPSPENYIAPGKRPMSSMSPSVLLHPNGSVALVIGAAGGPMITSSIAYVTARHLFLGENIKEAIDAARVHHQFIPNVVAVEDGVPREVLEVLKSKGHKLSKMGLSVVQGISVEGNVLKANSDYRKDGKTAGK